MKIKLSELKQIIKEEIGNYGNQAYDIGDQVAVTEDAYYKNATGGPSHFISKGMVGEIDDFADDEDGEFYIISFIIKQGYTRGSGQDEVLKIIVDADAMNNFRKQSE